MIVRCKLFSSSVAYNISERRKKQGPTVSFAQSLFLAFLVAYFLMAPGANTGSAFNNVQLHMFAKNLSQINKDPNAVGAVRAFSSFFSINVNTVWQFYANSNFYPNMYTFYWGCG